jgi:sterol desaturase/sphingolipid hydroxylase (fatty acid hydroxylase superfamily)
MLESFNVITNPTTRLTVLGLAVCFMLLEYMLSRLAHHHDETHDLAESATSLAVALGQNVVRAIEAGLVAIPFALAYEHRLFEFNPATPLAVAGLFVAVEFAYYWQHRAAHRIRWMWATHSVHHSASRLNFSAAVRLGWTGVISGNFLFFVPLAWLGFHPFAILAMLGANLLYQFFIHTELVGRLGPLEWVLNTPAHHRVHHASNESCLDKNYGGALIVFDRLFGTFTEAPRNEPLRYGLVGGARILNPIRVALCEWIAITRDLRHARSLRAVFRTLFGPPGAKVDDDHTIPVLPTHQGQKGLS